MDEAYREYACVAPEWEPPPKPNTKRRPKPASLQALTLRANVSRVGESEKALQSEESRMLRRMMLMGIPIDDLKPVVVAFAGCVNRRTSIFAGKYIVTLPRRGGNRTKFKQEYRRSGAERWLDALKRHNRAAYKKLEIGRTKSRREAVDLMAEIMQRGFKVMETKYKKEFRKRSVISHRMHAKLPRMGWRERLSGEYRKYEKKAEWMQSRADAAEQRCVHVFLLKDLF